MNDRQQDDEGERPRIKVTDRRKFTADGSPRQPDTQEQEEERAAEKDTDPGGARDDAGTADAAAPPPAPGSAATDPRLADDVSRSSFAPGGEPDAESDIVTPESAASPGIAASREAAASAEAAGEGPADPSAQRPPAANAGGPAPAERHRIEDLPRDFSAFIEGMYLEAMLYMGALPDPRTGETAEDLDMAKYKIDLLSMLEEKTQGNLTPEEARQLEEVLYQLRMFYVQKRGPGAQPQS